MNKININSIQKYKDYLVIDNKNTKVIFTTAKDNRSFHRHNEEGIGNLNSLKNDFNCDEVIYLKQIHSDVIYKYDGNNIDEIKENEGDALVTDVPHAIIGAFTADCVPVILVDDENKAVAAIHSGWKGTFKSITKKTIEKMKTEYGTDPKNLKAYIGAHIRQCCYEVSEELKDKFIKEKNDIDKDLLFEGRNLSMEECIVKNLRDEGVVEDNINSLGLCTYCNDEVPLFSYRKSNGDYGRMFSFVLIK